MTLGCTSLVLLGLFAYFFVGYLMLVVALALTDNKINRHDGGEVFIRMLLWPILIAILLWEAFEATRDTLYKSFINGTNYMVEWLRNVIK